MSKRYLTQYTNDGALLSVSIFENEIQTGHILNKYNDLNQVTERQDFWNYEFFANEEIELVNNRVYRLLYDSNGFIQNLTTEIYNPKDRNWKTTSQDFQCSIELNDNLYIAQCTCSGADFLIVTIDKKGHWIRKEEYRNGRSETGSLTYYE